MKTIIYPSITVISEGGWQKKVEEIRFFKLKKVGMFPTSLNKNERYELYQKAKELKIEVPFVHLRNDMGRDEIKYLIDNFKTKLFNVQIGRAHV